MTEDARNHEGYGASPIREKSRPSETSELNLFLDDWRQQPPSFILAKTYEECILLLQEFDINILSLDYHLGEVFTGYDVAVWIVEHDKWPKEVYFHTSDPVGQRRMYDLLAARAPESTRVTNGRYQSVHFTE